MINFTEELCQELLNLAKKTLSLFLQEDIFLDYEPENPAMLLQRAVFVTLRINGALRGCIGHMVAEMPLYKAVQEMTIAAAMDDPRFPPLGEDELAGVKIKISVLSPLKEISSLEEIEVGKHGVMIIQEGRRGVLLPEVPVSRGWDRETFLMHLCMKAGLPLDAWKNKPQLFTFTSNEFGED